MKSMNCEVILYRHEPNCCNNDNIHFLYSAHFTTSQGALHVKYSQNVKILMTKHS